jgi:hypothetical protein
LSVAPWLSFVEESSSCFPGDYPVASFGKTATPVRYANSFPRKQALIHCLKMCFGDTVALSFLAFDFPCCPNELETQRR